MKTTTVVILAFIAAFTSMGFITMKALEHRHETVDVKVPYRDTIYIDRGRSDCAPWYQYQIELGQDSTIVWNGQRLVAVMPYGNSNIDSLLIADNE